MRILFDSRRPEDKCPFGTLTPGQECTLRIRIPASVAATAVTVHLQHEDGTEALTAPLTRGGTDGPYDCFSGRFTLTEPGLYFYWFYVHKAQGGFRLFRQGPGDTNMEAGACWQVSCIPETFSVPDWARGAVMYQIFPDRYRKAGDCDLTGKLKPYTVHKSWDEEVSWQLTASGEVLNNDFYGGNFRGITEKLDDIAALGVTVLYLNPISKSFSSHRYDTGDYKTPDPMLGTEEDFRALCRVAHARGIRVVLDGVYSHTGADSLYFDKYRTFGGNGASCTRNSPYFSWYDFSHWPDRYRCWWDFDTLPTVNKLDPGFVDYVITGEDSVVAHWLRAGADGFRLDVADELPNEFLDLLKKRIRQVKPDALLIGEVWEDASNKVAYDVRKRYFVDGVLDSVMNYPFRTAILNFMREWDDGRGLRDAVMTICENYPPQVLQCCMNLLGTHDTPRILTALVDDFDGTREENAGRHLSPNQRAAARERLMMASLLQYTLPGAPSLYYGDEAGMEGCKDPFNRRPYPWGREDRELQAHYRAIGMLKKSSAPLRLGDLTFLEAGDHRLAYRRSWQGQSVKIYVNRSGDNWDVPAGKVLLGHRLNMTAPGWLSLLPMGYCVVEEEAWKKNS